MTALSALETSNPGEARARVDRIKTGVEVVWGLIVDSYQQRDWLALGYSTWDDMCTREFGTSRLRLPREERAETVQSLRDSGLSLRAIEAATGVSRPTIINDLRAGQVVKSLPPAAPVDTTTGEVLEDVHVEEGGETSDEIDARLGPIGGPAPATPAEYHPTVVTGVDGKAYPKPAPRKPPRKPLTEVAKTRGFTLREAMDAVLRLTEDDRYAANEKQVADALRGHLLYVAETVTAVLDQLS